MILLVLYRLLLAPPVVGIIIYATSYNNHMLSVLSLNGSSLLVVGQSLDCGSEPAWLTLDYSKSILYCLNEGWDENKNASITSFRTKADGTLETSGVLPLIKSPVAATLYGPRSEDLAIAFLYVPPQLSFITSTIIMPVK